MLGLTGSQSRHPFCQVQRGKIKSCNYRGLWATGCKQETDLGSSTRVASTLTCWVIFLTSITVLLKGNIWKHFVVKPQWLMEARRINPELLRYVCLFLLAPFSLLSFGDDNIYNSNVKGWMSLLNCELSLKDSRKFHSVLSTDIKHPCT